MQNLRAKDNSAQGGKRRFRCVVLRLDVPSDLPCRGCRRHRVVITSAAAREALRGLEGMRVCFDDYQATPVVRQACGIVTHAAIVGDALQVEGYLYASDFPEIVEQIERGTMGMSVQISDAHIEDFSADLWTVTRTTFAGLSVLERKHAAYQGTSLQLAASAD